MTIATEKNPPVKLPNEPVITPQIVAEHGFRQVSDEEELRVIAQAVIDANPKAVEDYRKGKKQVIGVLVRDLTQRAPGANRKVANELLVKLLG